MMLEYNGPNNQALVTILNSTVRDDAINRRAQYGALQTFPQHLTVENGWDVCAEYDRLGSLPSTYEETGYRPTAQEIFDRQNAKRERGEVRDVLIVEDGEGRPVANINPRNHSEYAKNQQQIDSDFLSRKAKGSGKSNSAPVYAPTRRSEICKFFNGRGCSNGSSCSFKHVKYEDVDDDRSHPYERGQNRNSSDWGDWNAGAKRPDSSNRRWEEGQNSSSSTARNVSEDDS